MLYYEKNQNSYTVIGCQNEVKEITIPATYKCKLVTKISDCAFSRHDKLTSVTIPNSVTTISSGVFYNCVRLTDVTIPNGITSIRDWTFRGCKSLKSVTIPNGVTAIGDYAFNGCKSLTSIVIPNSVTTIGNYAFEGCKLLTSKPRIYKAFNIKKNNTLMCRNMVYRLDKWNKCSGELELCKNGLHYCTNLFEIFNYYAGRLDKDIAICECEVNGEILTSDTSKCCAQRLKPVKRLTKQEIINILNGEE